MHELGPRLAEAAAKENVAHKIRFAISKISKHALVVSYTPLTFASLASVCKLAWATFNIQSTSTSYLPYQWSATITDLNLSQNSIAVLPQDMRTLTNLTALDVSRNLIPQVPLWLVDIPLTSLDVSENCITLLPPSLGKMKSLIKFNAFGNPLHGDQKLFADKGFGLFKQADAILGYLRQCREQVPAVCVTANCR